MYRLHPTALVSILDAHHYADKKFLQMPKTTTC